MDILGEEEHSKGEVRKREVRADMVNKGPKKKFLPVQTPLHLLYCEICQLHCNNAIAI